MLNRREKEKATKKDATGPGTQSETIFPKLGMLTTALPEAATHRQKNEQPLSRAASRIRRNNRRKYGTCSPAKRPA